MFAIDIFIVFRTTYVDVYSGEEVLDGKRIAIRYLFGSFLLGRFWLDLLATIPFDTIGERVSPGNTSFLQIFGILKLFRVTRLGRIIAYLNVKEDTKVILKLAKLVFFLIMYIHLVGCCWYWIVSQEKEWISVGLLWSHEKVFRPFGNLVGCICCEDVEFVNFIWRKR